MDVSVYKRLFKYSERSQAMSRITFLDSPMDAVSMSESVNSIKQRIQSGQFTQHVVVNVAKLVNMKNDPELARSVTECDIINIDVTSIFCPQKLEGGAMDNHVQKKYKNEGLFEIKIKQNKTRKKQSNLRC